MIGRITRPGPRGLTVLCPLEVYRVVLGFQASVGQRRRVDLFCVLVVVIVVVCDVKKAIVYRTEKVE